MSSGEQLPKPEAFGTRMRRTRVGKFIQQLFEWDQALIAGLVDSFHPVNRDKTLAEAKKRNPAKFKKFASYD